MDLLLYTLYLSQANKLALFLCCKATNLCSNVCGCMTAKQNNEFGTWSVSYCLGKPSATEWQFCGRLPENQPWCHCFCICSPSCNFFRKQTMLLGSKAAHVHAAHNTSDSHDV